MCMCLLYAIDEELISSVASISLTDSCHSVNEEATPIADPVIDGPKPPPPPSESLCKANMDLLPPLPPTTEVNLGSYNTQPTDHLHMQETYAMHPEDSLKKENEDLKIELNKLRSIVQRLQDENMSLRKTASEINELKSKVQRLNEQNLILLNQNTLLHPNHYQEAERLMKENGMPVPEQSAGITKQSEMVPKGSGTY